MEGFWSNASGHFLLDIFIPFLQAKEWCLKKNPLTKKAPRAVFEPAVLDCWDEWSVAELLAILLRMYVNIRIRIIRIYIYIYYIFTGNIVFIVSILPPSTIQLVEHLLGFYRHPLFQGCRVLRRVVLRAWHSHSCYGRPSCSKWVWNSNLDFHD